MWLNSHRYSDVGAERCAACLPVAVGLFVVVAGAEAMGQEHMVSGVLTVPPLAAEESPSPFWVQFSRFRETMNYLSQIKTSPGFFLPCMVEEIQYLYVQLLINAQK